jgi:hypothetical protein
MDKLSNFLYNHLVKKAKKGEPKVNITHTRIPSAVGVKPKVFGGCYRIEGDDLEEFNKLYYNSVIIGGTHEHLTEKQDQNSGVVYIDLDFRYSLENSGRKHGKEWTEDLIWIYLGHIKQLYNFKDKDCVKIYLMERQDGYIDDDKQVYKDGLHIIIDINMPRKLQLELRNMVMLNEDTIELMSRLPLENTLEDVFDKGLSTGATNVQLFGSRKPNREPYKLVSELLVEYDGTDGEWSYKPKVYGDDELDFETFKALSVQTDRPVDKFVISKNGQKKLLQLIIPSSPTSITTRINSGRSGDDLINEFNEYVDIIDLKAINKYPLWTKMVWALKSMGDEFKPVGLRLTKRSPLFQEEGGEEYFDKIWDSFNGGVLSKEFIMGYAKRSNEVEYLKIKSKYNSNISKILKQVYSSGAEMDFADLFLVLYGDNYKCVSSKNKVYYNFTDECIWEKSNGVHRVNLQTKVLLTHFEDRTSILNNHAHTLDDATDEYKQVLKEIEAVKRAIYTLKTSCKVSSICKFITDNIMDEDFESGMNRIIDGLIPVKNNLMFDTTTLLTTERTINNKFNYWCDVSFKDDITADELKDMDDYFKALFNNRDDTKQVMVNVIKSIFSGVTFRNIFFFTGDGSNGKSLLFKLLNKIFGKAMDVISNDVIIQKKGGSSSINTELAKLETTMLGYVTELKERDELNTTMIKKISGGDAIDYRGLFQGNKTIAPTSNLCVLTNKMPYFEVEPAIMNRMVVAPMNNVFPIDPTFETKMLGKLDLLFTYIMKQGKIITSLKKDDLTDEMLVAIEEYKEDNYKDYLGDFIKRNFDKCVYDEKAPINERKESRITVDEFLVEYKTFLKNNGYRNNTDTKSKFTRNMKKYHGILTWESNHIIHYIGIKRRPPPPPDNINDTEIEYVYEEC